MNVKLDISFSNSGTDFLISGMVPFNCSSSSGSIQSVGSSEMLDHSR